MGINNSTNAALLAVRILGASMPEYFAKMKKEPSMLQAGDYSAATQYLAAVKAIGTDDADKVMVT